VRSKTVLLGLLLFVTVLSVLQVSRARATPAFARREGVPCQNCHYRMPELDGDGNAYIRRGFREELGGTKSWFDMSQGSAPTAKAELGDASPLAWQNYLTVLGHPTIEAEKGSKTVVNPGSVEAWLGGPIDAHFSGFAIIGFDLQTGEAGVEQAYAQFNSSVSERFLTVRAGQFLPWAVYFNGGGVGMPLSVPVALETATGDENPWTPTTSLRGLEVGAVDMPKWNVYAGGVQPVLDGMDGVIHTDFYASAEYIVNQAGSAISAFGYFGKIPGSTGQEVDYDRAALFANFYLPRTKALVGGLWGKDKPTGLPDFTSKGAFAQAEFLMAERWAAYGRYDYASREVPGESDVKTDGPTIGLTFWAQTQIRLTAEAQFLKETGSERNRSGVAEILWAF